MQFNLELSSETFWRLFFLIITLGSVFLAYRTAPLVVVEQYQNCTCPKSVYESPFFYNTHSNFTYYRDDFAKAMGIKPIYSICGNKTYKQVPCDCWKEGCLIDCFECV